MDDTAANSYSCDRHPISRVLLENTHTPRPNPRGQPSLDCLLDRLPIGSDAVPERDCWELVRALRGVGQPHAARDVCVRAGRAAAARGDAGAALAWMAESGSLERVQAREMVHL